jgi:hypothetical protein
LIKQIFKFYGHDVPNFAAVAAPGTTSSASIRLQITYQVNLTATPVVYPVTAIGGVTTFNALVVDMMNNLMNQITPDFIFLSASLNQVDTTNQFQRTMNLSKSTVHMHVKSALKIQNQTVPNLTDNDASDVTRIPLHGKSYEGAGNYLMAKPTSSGAVDYLAHVGTVALANQPPTAKFTAGEAHPWAEPPRKAQLYRVKKQAGAHLDPGEIRTSVLTYTKSFNLNTLVRSLAQKASPGCLNIGNYRAFFFEKMLNFLSADAAQQIKIVYEHDHKTAMYMTSFAKQDTTSTINLNI